MFVPKQNSLMLLLTRAQTAGSLMTSNDNLTLFNRRHEIRLARVNVNIYAPKARLKIETCKTCSKLAKQLVAGRCSQKKNTD